MNPRAVEPSMGVPAVVCLTIGFVLLAGGAGSLEIMTGGASCAFGGAFVAAWLDEVSEA